MNWQIHVNV